MGLPKADAWNPAWYVIPGVIVGVVLDRLLESPGGINGGLILVGIATATVTFAGPLLAERSHQRFEREAERSRRREEHAMELVQSPYAFLHTIWSTWSSGETSDKLEETLGLRFQDSASNLNGPVESAAFWAHAREHILADKQFGPVWIELERRVKARNLARWNLDMRTSEKVRAAFSRPLGGTVELTRNLATPGPERWVDGGIATRLVVVCQDMLPVELSGVLAALSGS